MPYWVGIFGVQSRQRYLTSNNRLRQTIGASKLIDRSMDWWRQSGAGEELLYVGGGVAAVRFDSREIADARARQWSREWVVRAPGLRLVAGIARDQSLGKAWERARLKGLPFNEELSLLGDELGALPVTQTCPDTGLAASKFFQTLEGKQWLSAEAVQKEEEQRFYNRQLDGDPQAGSDPKVDRYRSEVLGDRFKFPRELDNLGMQLGARHVALIHCDGNGMADLFGKEMSSHGDHEFRAKVYKTSEDCSRASLGAIIRTLKTLISRLPALSETISLVDAKHNRSYLPVRPLVDSGDDVTWIAHGRLGLLLAVEFCWAFEQLTEQFLGKRHTACAGVLLMPVGFPFARGLELASALCQEAKKARKKKPEGDTCRSWIDFHAVLEGSASDIKDIRKQKYREPLLGRPYSLGSGGSFDRFHRTWRKFAVEEPWRDARSRAKALLNACERSNDAAQEMMRLFESQGYRAPESNPHYLFDPLELLDFHVDFTLPWETQGVDHA